MAPAIGVQDDRLQIDFQLAKTFGDVTGGLQAKHVFAICAWRRIHDATVPGGSSLFSPPGVDQSAVSTVWKQHRQYEVAMMH
jgi:hypothetical protein